MELPPKNWRLEQLTDEQFYGLKSTKMIAKTRQWPTAEE